MSNNEKVFLTDEGFLELKGVIEKTQIAIQNYKES